MQETRAIKVIQENLCPHCGKKILTAIRMTSPAIEWTLGESAIKDAKEKMKKELYNVTFKSEESKKQAFAWLGDKRTIFGPAEVNELLSQIKQEQKGKEVPK